MTGKGKPINRRAERNRTTPVAGQLVPEANTAALNYEEIGGQLTWFPSFGVDPLADSLETQQRRNEI